MGAAGVVLIASACLFACERRSGESAGASPPTSVTSAGSRTATDSAATTALMDRHEILALETRDALARGDMKSATRFARDLARVRMSPATVDFGERISDMHAAATNVAKAAQSESREASANAFGALVRTCSDCHARLTGPTRLEGGGSPVPASSSSSLSLAVRRGDMRRHAFAMDRLWDGLVFNSEGPWREGASILSNSTLMADDLISDGGDGVNKKKTPVPAVEEAARSIGDFGRKATETSDVGERSKLMGRLVNACATCHERTGGGGGPHR
jgi:hypothetical protein